MSQKKWSYDLSLLEAPEAGGGTTEPGDQGSLPGLLRLDSNCPPGIVRLLGPSHECVL